MQDQLQGHPRPAQAAARAGEMRRVPARLLRHRLPALRRRLRQGAAEGWRPLPAGAPVPAAASAPARRASARPAQAAPQRRPGSAGGPARRPAARPAADPAAAPAAPQTVIAADEELKTAFFLSDSTFGPYSQTRAEDVVPPRSIVARDGPCASQPMQGGDERADDSRRRRGRGPRRRREPDPPRGAVGLAAPAQPDAACSAPGEDDDPDVAAANLLARQARDAYRGGAGGRRSTARMSRRAGTAMWKRSARTRA